MGRRNPLLLFLTLLLISPWQGFCLEETAASPAWTPLLEKAKDLKRRGAYLEAQKIYESLLADETLGRRKTFVRREYETLTVKIIFSPIETPDSFFHTVMEGDTLYELAKKYGTTIALLKKSNGLRSADQIRTGMKLKVTRSKFSIEVNRKGNELTLMADGKPLKRYRVATGGKEATPPGTFKIVNKLENPTWYHAGVIVPPDSPNNILGTRWLGFDAKGYGLHGTTLPHTIGTHASKGCIRMLNSDVEEIYDLVPLGTQVLVSE